MTNPASSGDTLLDFGDGLPRGWEIVNDGVMGGRSSSTLRWDDAGVGIFEGELSLENNGGFASFRAPIDIGALAGATALRVRVRGDGRRYQLRLKPGHGSGGISWKAELGTEPSGEWTTESLPLDAFEPTYRGRRPTGVGPLDTSEIGQVGIMLVDGRHGAFRLEIAWVEKQ